LSVHIEALPYDSEVAKQLVDELFADLNERYGVEDDEGAGWYAEVTPEKVAPPNGVFLVASVDGSPAGCGALKRISSEVGEIKRMYTAPRGRRRGVARALLARLEDEARAMGYTSLQLETGDVQPEAIALYESTGWTRIPPYGRYADDPRSICFAKPV
jgi:GNAT superfamily N-acetyltransferase